MHELFVFVHFELAEVDAETLLEPTLFHVDLWDVLALPMLLALKVLLVRITDEALVVHFCELSWASQMRASQRVIVI